MSKKVIWSTPGAKVKPAGTYGSFQELMAKSEKIRQEHQEAQEYLQKAMPAMLKLLEIRMTNGEPLTVMRPLRYQTSVLEKSDGFYANQVGRDKFVDQLVTINPGTQLILKSLDVPLREFVFQDALGNEHPISFDDRNMLMTQTDIFETVKKLLNVKGDNNE